MSESSASAMPEPRDPAGTTPAPTVLPQSQSNVAAEPGPEKKPKAAKESGGLAAVRETALVVVVALALSLIVKTFLVQAFYIPSGSMERTLQLKDRVMVSKLTPGPFELHRGDIIVFTDFNNWLDPALKPATNPGPVTSFLRTVGLLPSDSNDHLIKRIIGMPGDRVQCCGADGRIKVNGLAIDEPYLFPGNPPSQAEFDITVPAGRVWVMGDHRSDSADSRAHDENSGGKIGSVPISRITGKAFALVWPLSNATWLGRPEGTFDQLDNEKKPPSLGASSP